MHHWVPQRLFKSAVTTRSFSKSTSNSDASLGPTEIIQISCYNQELFKINQQFRCIIGSHRDYSNQLLQPGAFQNQPAIPMHHWVPQTQHLITSSIAPQSQHSQTQISVDSVIKREPDTPPRRDKQQETAVQQQQQLLANRMQMEMIAQAGGLQAGGYAPQTQQHLQEMQQMQLHQLHRNNGGGEDSSAGDPPHSKRMKRQEEKEWAQSTT